MPVRPSDFCSRPFKMNPGANDQQLLAAERGLGTALPIELRALLGFSDGFEGWPGPEPNDWYVQILSTSELIEYNHSRGIKDQWPELIIFGGDGAGEGFYFDPTRPGPPILMIAHSSVWREDYILYASSMGEFIERMHAGYDPFRQSSD